MNASNSAKSGSEYVHRQAQQTQTAHNQTGLFVGLSGHTAGQLFSQNLPIAS